MSGVDRDRITAAARLVGGAGALLVTAGAGMGVDSGLPDFRGDTGFWAAYPPYARLGLRFAELADPEHFADDPALAWGFYGHRLHLYRATVPHPGFAVLRRWAQRVPTSVFTSNVDGQFQRAGFPAGDVAEVHGSIHHLQCLDLCGYGVWPADGTDVPVDPDTMRATGPLPRCPGCGGLARPAILMFGDTGWDGSHAAPALRRHDDWLATHRSRVVVVEIGAGTALPTVRRRSELAAAATGALVRINVREPEVRHGRGVAVGGPAAASLAAIDAAIDAAPGS
ncbi:SIR2 family NAD-dependent protein deacylase [Pseudonocardia sp. HH130630-07]|uniref:SIR2 family NAD-dependent protein deacylase n=1 Tax=Pseudonocardia sp. HH130630-07 TaxID=1690815 RepID=UPI0008152BF6|nr:Sir2 family NAD-dependent protein deacetylase [Pseudonocardia sp. HH130630-07]ANY07067.1 NAD-dependent protein deacetylase [Pseudonocardia sp. HH130630-07]